MVLGRAERRQLLLQLVLLGVGQVCLFFTLRWAMDFLDPLKARKAKAAAAGKKAMERLKAGRLTLTEHEGLVAMDMIDPSEISASWATVGGLDHVVKTLQENVVLPFTRPDIFRPGSLSGAPKGVLLYGPPGCGKTLLAKALARECDCCFIALQPSTFMDKWYGESQKLVEALFSLARKLEPTLIFIDEIDSVLRARQSQDHETGAVIKAQFMSLWDGFASDNDCRVVVVGATNRPRDLDRAILRRLPCVCKVELPAELQRASILTVLLANEEVEAGFDPQAVAAQTPGFSGSSLQELCRQASMFRVQELLALAPAAQAEATLRPLTVSDFMRAKLSMDAANTLPPAAADVWSDAVDSLD